MTTGAATFDERKLLKQTTLTVTVKSGPVHRRMVRFGLWVMTVGARIAGIGHVNVEV